MYHFESKNKTKQQENLKEFYGERNAETLEFVEVLIPCFLQQDMLNTDCPNIPHFSSYFRFKLYLFNCSHREPASLISYFCLKLWFLRGPKTSSRSNQTLSTRCPKLQRQDLCLLKISKIWRPDIIERSDLVTS